MTDEQQTKEEVKTEAAKESTEDGDKPKTFTAIDDANLAAKRLEDANKIKSDLLDREERLLAEAKLGGKSEGGEGSNTKEETPKEYKDKVMRGEI